MKLTHVCIGLSLIGLSFSYPTESTPREKISDSLGSDLGLYNPENNTDIFEGDILRKRPEMTKNAISSRKLYWPNAVVIYKTEASIGCPYSEQCKLLMEAMAHYEDETCVRFKEWTGEKNYVSVFFNPDGGSCWSSVGMIGGEQKLSLGQRCWYKGIVVHELGHAVGFYHEMNRPDRDDHIYIFWENIIPSLRGAFQKNNPSEVNLLGEQFDFKSVMMYDEYAFSKDNQSPTIQAKNNVEIGPIWRKKRLSQSDVRRVHKLYKCDGNKQKARFPTDITCSFDWHTCGFKDIEETLWFWKKIPGQGGYLFSTFEKSQTRVAELESINFHSLSSLDTSRGPYGCVSFAYLIMTDAKAYLRLSQAYLESSQQVFINPETAYDLWLEDNATPEWTRVTIPLYVTKPFRLIFESKFDGNPTRGTIAIDNVQVKYTPCPDTNSQTYAPFVGPEVTTATEEEWTEDLDSSTFANSFDSTTKSIKTEEELLNLINGKSSSKMA